MTTPIKPSEIVGKHIPDAVIEVFNELISENYIGGHATVMQDDVVSRVAEKMNVTRSHIFQKGWLNIEKLFTKAGWKVTYDKPAYNETYDANFKFSKKK